MTGLTSRLDNFPVMHTGTMCKSGQRCPLLTAETYLDCSTLLHLDRESSTDYESVQHETTISL